MSVSTLLISCSDRTGIVAALSDFVATHGGNILDADQHSEPPPPPEVGAAARERSGVAYAAGSSSGSFFMRLAFDRSAFVLTPEETRQALGHLGKRFDLDWRLYEQAQRPRLALLCSKTPHCVYDLLMREAMGELAGEVACVVSNHEALRGAAEHFGKPFFHVPVSPESKPQAEQTIRGVLADHGADTVVLARYMQVLSAELCAEWAERAINIHHSFLPAFVGARPYAQAKAKGVKIIGATAHYVTADLDQGPIIEQDVIRVTHRDAVEDLVRKGRDIERQVLARAVQAHLEHRVLVHGNRTIVFQ
ncbi:MAG: formyltetrahydrofolate deformylase [Planctomycetota bacterium]